MSDKTKKIVECVGWGAAGVGVAALIVVGISTEEINSFIALIDGSVVAVGAVVALLAGKLKK